MPSAPRMRVGDIGRLFEEGGPDRLEGGLGAHHGEEPEAAAVGVPGEGVGRGGEATGADGMEVVGCHAATSR